MRMYSGVCLVLCCLGLVSSKSAVDPELYNEYWDQEELLPGFLERLRQTIYRPEYNEYLDYRGLPNEVEDTSRNLQLVPGWPSRKTNEMIGQVGGIALDSKGDVVVFHRADRRWEPGSFGTSDRISPLLGPIQKDVLMWINNETGEITKQAGTGEYYMPHGLTIDKDDNLWITDVGLHQVIKIPKDPKGAKLVLGEKLVPGSDVSHFCKPTDVAVASSGEFFVADGYCNGRIMKFSPEGNLIGQWGHMSAGSPLGNFDLHIPHSLALDESRDRICVADRENGRILCYTAGLNGTKEGVFINRFEPQRGTIYAIDFDSAGELFAVNGPGFPVTEGFTLDTIGNIEDFWGPTNNGFPGQPHDVTVSRDGRTVFVGDIEGEPKLWRFSSKRTPVKTVG